MEANLLPRDGLTAANIRVPLLLVLTAGVKTFDVDDWKDVHCIARDRGRTSRPVYLHGKYRKGGEKSRPF